MAHCSSCGDAGNRRRAPSAGRATPGEGRQHPIPAPAAAGTPWAGQERGGPTFIAPSPLTCGAPQSSLGRRSAAAQPPTEGAEGAAPGGGPPGPPPNLTSNRRLQQTQAQVEEVVDIMRVNVDKVLERDQKLSELDDRADALQAGASQFESSAAKLKRKYWWKNCKMMIMLGAICAIIVVVIVSKYR
ncbi:vesicle-associated membrane protein 1 [Phocoena phocoena]|uniref:vesicle-associated membrane protein 1 n=1 Tax=Phocoena phocoena TaxID=9742 RepID=UPI003306CFA2